MGQKLLKETIKTVKHEQKTGRPRTKPLGRPRKEPKVTLTAAELEEKVFHKDEEEKNIEEFLEEIESSLPQLSDDETDNKRLPVMTTNRFLLKMTYYRLICN